jgi:Zn-dependent metalloprotease
MNVIRLSKTLQFSLLSIIMLGSSQLFSQDRTARMAERVKGDIQVSKYLVDPERKTPSFISFNNKQAVDASRLNSLLTNFLDIRNGVDELKPKNTTTYVNGLTVIKQQQYFKGVKVEHGLYIATVRNGNLLSANGSYYDISSTFSTNPSLSESQALANALAVVNPKKMAYEQLDEVIKKFPQQRMVLQKERDSYVPHGQLVIVKDFSNKSNPLRLAYKFDVYAAEPLYRANIYVDALDGHILLKDMIIKHTDGTAQTRYAGTRQIKTKQVTAGLLGATDPANGLLPYTWTGTPLRTPISNSSFFILHDDTRGAGIMTFDLNGVGGAPLSVPALYAQATSFTDPDNIWGDGDALTNNDHKRGTDVGGAQAGGVGEAENDDVALDAHWGAEMVYDYWKNIHNRLSFDNANSAIKNYVHYGVAYDNAFWNGTAMTYGDGSGDDNPALLGFKPLTSLDVCGHEIGHGVCSYTADLVYEKESGAMNEGFSDIWAACMENYVLKNVDGTLPYEVWGIGEQIDVRPGRALRRMNDPNAEGNPDTYGGAFWSNPDCDPNLANDQCGVHNNSGVLNHWFYQLVAGDNLPHVNDVNQTFQVKGIGFNDGERIAYLTELKLTPTATFADAREAALQAAIELFGQCSPQHQATANAWHAVGVGAAFEGNCTVSVNFVDAASSVSEETGTTACGTTKTHTIYVNRPIASASALTLTITTSGTATLNADYSLPKNTVSWAANETGSKAVTLVINGDQLIEQDETIVLSFIPPTGVSSAVAQHAITINDDDVTPVIGAAPVTLLIENFEGGSLPNGWTPNKGAINTAANQWTVGNAQAFGTGSGSAYITIGINNLPVYETNEAADVVLRTPLLNARGLSSVQVSFSYAVGGERDLPSDVNPDRNGDGQITADEIASVPLSGPALDYGRLVYSLDGEHFFDVGDPLALSPTKKSITISLPAAVNNKNFYLGFRWVNDALLSFMPTPSFVVDDVVVKAVPKQIQSTVNKIAESNIPRNETAYLQSIEDGKLIAKVTNTGNVDLGCIRGNLTQSGNNKVAFMNGVRSEKVFDFSNVNKKGTYAVTLYFTNQEFANWVNNISQLRVAKTTAADLLLANNGNTQVYQPIVDDNGGAYYTVAVPSGNNNGKFFLYLPGGTVSSSALSVDRMMSDNASVRLFPNPASTTLRVEIGELSGTTQIQLLNKNGQVMESRNVYDAKGKSVIFDVSKYPGGIYNIRIVNKGQSFVKPVGIVR